MTAASLAALAFGSLLSPGVALAQDDPEQDGSDVRTDDEAGAELQLAQRHAPILRFRAPSEACADDGERFTPLAVAALLDNEQVMLRQVGRNDPVVQRGPSAADLFDHGEGFYLDFPGGALAPGCIYEQDAVRYTDADDTVVYAHVATEDDRPGFLALQYWFFYYYNDYNNRHEGDWEGIQLLFEADTAEEALATEPVSVGYAQHVGGERASWDAEKLERQGDRPVVYPSVGSHASYFGTNLYLGRSASEGFGCDDTQDALDPVDPTVVVLPDEVTDADDPLAWLDFGGHWGERHSGPFNGPKGPTTKSRWSEPVTWHDELRPSSVIVPGGPDSPTPVLNTFCSVVAFGSSRYIDAQQNPLRVTAMLVAAIAVAAFALTRTGWDAVAATPIVRRRRVGEILRAAARTYRQHPARFIEIGLIYMPLAVVFAVFSGFLDEFTPTDSENAVVSLLGLVAGSLAVLGQSVAYVLITAVFASLWLGAEAGERVTGIEGYRRMGRRFGDLFRTHLRVLAIVIGLFITIVGIPFAIIRLVRYQFFGQVIMVEGLSGSQSLDRSSELVRGRWFHTALAALTFGGLVSLVNATVGLLLLVVLAGLPLWLFSVMASAASALVVPISAVSNVLLYGDARAELEGAAAAGPVDADDDDPLDPEVVRVSIATTSATTPPAS